ncbi:uncharacterized protein Z520_00307 [Fonsecaea multimorphosa CBS 102226]|uniref:Transcription factor domain-containing protein n=1 Tax=Fonsecaea multimorphosa CBS 102226 TaxID=1442371 RepID=A0A0D2HP60_9EURO|nr:uncharacterized protein Z520_00307 [Fonsecaea multimorphosa CBS 102226]KIY03616.1 hypothetical protein Z520_00307 [Fonsecaea multimorphosa CBS 102226]OAL32317.1 hypothetical protein AYO22_00339 [Fonsecaea multimorphosa]
MSEQSKKENTSASVPEHVFIDQRPESVRREKSKLVSSQARRFQSAGKRQQQRLSARQDAGYARSLVGWRSTSSTPPVENQGRESPLTSGISEEQSTELDEANETEMNLALQTGLRTDPFSAFPGSNTKEVMFMVDYHIHVWAPHKAGNFDQLMGYNTQLDLCWPLALQDEMLFDATVAVSQTAWVLAQGNRPSEDQLMLYHRGLAMTRLRQRVSLSDNGQDEAVIFTIGRMISIAYMSSEAEAFVAHFEAFRKIAQRYIDDHPNNEVARVVQNRLDSWKALHGYRNRKILVRNHSNPSEPASTEPQSGRSSPPKRHMRAQSPTLLSGLDLSVDLAASLNSMQRLLDRIQPFQNLAGQSRRALELIERCRQFDQILQSCDNLSATEIQLCCALVAFCLQLYRHHVGEGPEAQGAKGHDSEQFDFLPALADLASTFINKQLEGFSESAEQRMCLTWSAMVLGSFLLHHPDNRLRTKGHIIHANLGLNLGEGFVGELPPSGTASLADEDSGWTNIEASLNGPSKMGSLWHTDLALQWRRDWQGSVKRQRRWEQQGVWMIGVPKKILTGESGRSSPGGKGKRAAVSPERTSHTPFPLLSLHQHGEIDAIEYLVLRDARDSLPRIE